MRSRLVAMVAFWSVVVSLMTSGVAGEPALTGHLEVGGDNSAFTHNEVYTAVVETSDPNATLSYAWAPELPCGEFVVDADPKRAFWNHGEEHGCPPSQDEGHHPGVIHTGTVSVTVSDGSNEIVCTTNEGNEHGFYECTLPPPDKCPGFENDARPHIIGTSENDTLLGTSAGEIICGLGGVDNIQGGGGNDVLLGGSDDDEIRGGADGDVIEGGGGDDTMFARGGVDRVRGGPGLDFITGGPQDDHLFGEGGGDNISGDAGDDTIEGGDAGDELDGGADTDTIRGGAAKDEIWGDHINMTRPEGAGDRLFGDGGNDTIFGVAGRDRLEGGEGTDTLDGGDQVDTCLGGPDQDSFFDCEAKQQQ